MSSHSLMPWPCFAILLIGVSGCGGDGGGGPAPNPTVTVAKADPSGDGQTGAVGTPLSDAVRVVVREDGVAKPDVTVSWSTGVAGGSLVPASSTTDADGLAATEWTLGQTAGTQTAQASVTGASGSPVGFSATALPGPAAGLASAGGVNQSGDAGSALAAPLQVRARDQFGNGVSGVPVSWTVTQGGGTVAPSTSTTNESGLASASLTLGATPGTNRVEAASQGLDGSPVTFTAEGVQPAAAVVTVQNNSFVQATVAISAGEAVRWNYVAGAVAHNIIPVPPNTLPSQPTLQNGPFVYQVAFPTPGTYKYYCSNHGAVDGAGNTSGMAGQVVVQ